jgi:hypothetical protein
MFDMPRDTELARPMPPRCKSLFLHGRVTLLAATMIRGIRMDQGR